MRKLSMEELGRKTVAEFKAADKTPVVLVLDNVRSMHNVGSVFRTADAFLVQGIVLCGYTPVPRTAISRKPRWALPTLWNGSIFPPPWRPLTN
ncbi:TrmH family RNA methyltransferase [Chitinophaga sedimenti]|uniref:TrmH family RNA methyltransferase n=1 Tax=Chitinophaga sedimenti TaxID=2033606 RepID=UPI00249E6606|nr:TrmH family RNA methyltransferase [Chitinophaga sedimenti]